MVKPKLHNTDNDIAVQLSLSIPDIIISLLLVLYRRRRLYECVELNTL